MKNLLLISFFVLLMRNGLCTTQPEADAKDASDDTATATLTDTTFQDVDVQDDKSDLQSALDTGDGITIEADTPDAQDLKLKFTKGKDIIITLSPEGGGGGVSYTRWGKMSCPSGATLVYEGFAAGGWYHQKGNGANFLCMPKDPQYTSTTAVAWPSLLYGAEYETANRIFHGTTQNYNVPCAVCHVPKSAKIMLPGKVSCPSSWTREYYGYLMTSLYNHHQNVLYECVDNAPDRIPGSKRNRNGALFYFVQVQCSYGLPCRPYIARRPVTCAVCTK